MEARSRESVEAMIAETVARVVREEDQVGLGRIRLNLVAGVAAYVPPPGTSASAIRDVLREAIWMFEQRRREGGVDMRRARWEILGVRVRRRRRRV